LIFYKIYCSNFNYFDITIKTVLFQVVYESPPQVSAQPVALVVKKVTLPTVDESETSKSADNSNEKQQPASNHLPEVTTARKKNPVAMVVHPIVFMPCSPSVLPELFKLRSHPTQRQTERFSVIRAKLQDTAQLGKAISAFCWGDL
jgi:hypothetical protein